MSHHSVSAKEYNPEKYYKVVWGGALFLADFCGLGEGCNLTPGEREG